MAGALVVSHSRVVGSPDLEDWMWQAVGSVQNFLWEHLLEPGAQIRKELQRTFKSNKVLNCWC
jgi:hypothetical protein